MSRSWKRPRSATFNKWFRVPHSAAHPRRSVILYVDLQEVPDFMAALRLPEAYLLTRENIPNLTEEEDSAFLTYMDFFRYDSLNKSMSAILDDVYERINRA